MDRLATHAMFHVSTSGYTRLCLPCSEMKTNGEFKNSYFIQWQRRVFKHKKKIFKFRNYRPQNSNSRVFP